jgi:hypothetical protein
MSSFLLIRSDYFHLLEWGWSVLFGWDWAEIYLPDLHRILLHRSILFYLTS